MKIEYIIDGKKIIKRVIYFSIALLLSVIGFFTLPKITGSIGGILSSFLFLTSLSLVFWIALHLRSDCYDSFIIDNEKIEFFSQSMLFNKRECFNICELINIKPHSMNGILIFTFMKNFCKTEVLFAVREKKFDIVYPQLKKICSQNNLRLLENEK